MFLFVALASEQTELGDLFRVTLLYEEEQVKEVIVKYFDTIPVRFLIRRFAQRSDFPTLYQLFHLHD